MIPQDYMYGKRWRKIISKNSIGEDQSEFFRLIKTPITY